MESDKCISTSSAATAKNQLTINDLDDYSLGMIFNKLPYIDRTCIENVCQRWCDVSKANWCNYIKSLTIGQEMCHFLPLDDRKTTRKKNILVKILQRSSPYLEQITFLCFLMSISFFRKGTIKWIVEVCPKLKRLNAGSLRLNVNDLVACRNLEALSFVFMTGNSEDLGLLFRNNKRLRRLEVYSDFLATSDLDHLNPGQLELLHLNLRTSFELTTEIVDKLAESLVALKYRAYFFDRPTLLHLGKLKNLRSLNLAFTINSLEIEFIVDIVENFRKLECLLLCILTQESYDQNVFVPLLDMPSLRRLIIIIDNESDIPPKERDSLLQRGTHLESFVIETCYECSYYKWPDFNIKCYQHSRDWYW